MHQKCMCGRTRPHMSASLMQTHAAQEPVADLLIRRRLEAAGVRPPRPRLALARAIFGSGDRHFTAETLYHETRALYFAPSLGTIYNTLSEFARRGLLREIPLYDAKVWYETKTAPHFHFYFADTEELTDIPNQIPEIEITPPDGTRVAAIDVIVRLKNA